MKKVFSILCLVFVAIGIAVCGIVNVYPHTDFLVSADVAEKISLVSEVTPTTNVTSFTPLKKGTNGYSGQRYGGQSFVPTYTQNPNGFDYIGEQTTSLNGLFNCQTILESDLENYGIKIWIYFDTALQSDFTIGFISSSDASKKVVWELSSGTLTEILTKTDLDYQNGGDYDRSELFAGTTAPYGWNHISLPLSKSKGIDSITETIIENEGTEQEASYNIINLSALDRFYICQQSSDLASSHMYFYNIEFSDAGFGSGAIVSTIEKQPYVFVKQKVNVGVFTQKPYYVGEYFRLPGIDEVFSYLYIGDKNLLSDEFKNDNYFAIKVETNGSSKYYSYGTEEGTNCSFKMQSNAEYILKFLFGNGNGSFPVLVGKTTLKPQNYGTGAWFTTTEVKLDVGEKYSANFQIHSAFAGTKPEFASTNDKVIKIVKVDYINNVVEIEAVGEGSANIVITIFDDRLNKYQTDYENGITNSDFTATVVSPKANVDFVAVLLWSCGGLIVVYLIYLIIKTIKNRNNYQVR